MSNILDQIIDATAPRVVKSEHNTVNIKVEEAAIQQALRGLIPGGGGWDAAEYGITAEQAAAMLAAADTPEARERVMNDLRQRAISRAGLDVSNGKVSVMTVVGPKGEKLPWHQLGTMIAEAVSSAQAAALANLEWTVVKVPSETTSKNGKKHVSKDTFLLMREDTWTQLGSTGNKYQVINNAAGFSFLDEVLEEFGASYETAGAIYGGRKVWMQAKMPGLTFSARKGTMTEFFATFILDHSGGGCDVAFATAQEIVCANTMRMANGDKSKGIRIRHTGDVRAKVADAQKAMGITVRRAEKYKEAAAELVKTPLEIEPFANDVLDCVLEITATKALMGADVLAAAIATTEAERKLKEKTFQRQIDERHSLVDDILCRYEPNRCEPKGSAWAGLQAVTESADWFDQGKRKKEFKQDRRLESIVYGEADEVKQQAYRLALQTIS